MYDTMPQHFTWEAILILLSLHIILKHLYMLLKGTYAHTDANAHQHTTFCWAIVITLYAHSWGLICGFFFFQLLLHFYNSYIIVFTLIQSCCSHKIFCFAHNVSIFLSIKLSLFIAFAIIKVLLWTFLEIYPEVHTYGQVSFWYILAIRISSCSTCTIFSF